MVRYRSVHQPPSAFARVRLQILRAPRSLRRAHRKTRCGRRGPESRPGPPTLRQPSTETPRSKYRNGHRQCRLGHLLHEDRLPNIAPIDPSRKRTARPIPATAPDGRIPCAETPLRRLRWGCRHEKAIVRKAGSRAVVHDETILTQHRAITCLADCECRPVIDVEPVEEECGIWSLNIDLAERRHIAEANGGSDAPHLAVHYLQPVAIARAGKILSTQPESGLDKDRVLLLGPGV